MASDHAGFKLKEKIKKFLINKNFKFEDLGPKKYNKKDDYPDFAKMVCKKVAKEKVLGILICGTGQGMCIAANKQKGIRAALSWNKKTAKHAKEHLNANIICLGSKFVNEKQTKEIINVWMKSKFQKGRSLRRLNKI